jgi:hypothetical protein
MNHCRRLANMVRPVYEETDLELKRSKRHVAGRLIEEMTEIIAQLRHTLPQSIDS